MYVAFRNVYVLYIYLADLDRVTQLLLQFFVKNKPNYYLITWLLFKRPNFSTLIFVTQVWRGAIVFFLIQKVWYFSTSFLYFSYAPIITEIQRHNKFILIFISRRINKFLIQDISVMFSNKLFITYFFTNFFNQMILIGIIIQFNNRISFSLLMTHF